MKMLIKLSDQEMKCLLIQALEGGSNYWYMLGGPKPYEQGLSKAERIYKSLKNGESYKIEDSEDGSYLGELNYTGIKYALTCMIDEGSVQHICSNIIWENWDAGDADVWFQFAVMGELVYG